MEKAHAANYQVLLGEFKVVVTLGLIFLLTADHSKGEFAFFRAFLSDVIECKEASAAGQGNSVLEVVFELPNL